MNAIFVGCLPPTAQKKALFEYFSYFGNIASTSIRLDEHGMCIGNGTVGCKDQRTFENILLFQNHIFQGRKIYCSKHLSGAELDLKNKLLNGRRAYLSKIPAQLSNEDLAYHLSQFGPVQSAYRIASVEGVTKPYGFAAFFDQRSAAKAIECGVIWLGDNKRIRIQEFKPKLKAQDKPKPVPSPANSEVLLAEHSRVAGAHSQRHALWNKKPIQSTLQPNRLSKPSGNYFSYNPLELKPTQKQYHASAIFDVSDGRQQTNIRYNLTQNERWNEIPRKHRSNHHENSSG